MSTEYETTVSIEKTILDDNKKKKMVKKKIIKKATTEEEKVTEEKIIPNTCEKKNKDYETDYVNELSEMERITYNIAKEHLGTSFNLQKSIGFITWYEKSKV